MMCLLWILFIPQMPFDDAINFKEVVYVWQRTVKTTSTGIVWQKDSWLYKKKQKGDCSQCNQLFWAILWQVSHILDGCSCGGRESLLISSRNWAGYGDSLLGTVLVFAFLSEWRSCSLAPASFVPQYIFKDITSQESLEGAAWCRLSLQQASHLSHFRMVRLLIFHWTS